MNRFNNILSLVMLMAEQHDRSIDLQLEDWPDGLAHLYLKHYYTMIEDDEIEDIEWRPFAVTSTKGRG